MIEDRVGGRIIQMMPAAGWHAFEFTQDEDGNIETKEVPVIGWGLRESGDITLLIADPNDENGYAVMSICERPCYEDERYGNKVVHYQAVAPFQELPEVAPRARSILQVRRSDGHAAPQQSPKPIVSP